MDLKPGVKHLACEPFVSGGVKKTTYMYPLEVEAEGGDRSEVFFVCLQEVKTDREFVYLSHATLYYNATARGGI